MVAAAAHALGLSVVISSSIESSLGLIQPARPASATPQTIPGLDYAGADGRPAGNGRGPESAAGAHH